MSRSGLENFIRLLGGERRIAFQQSGGVGERDVDGSDRLCCTAYNRSPRMYAPDVTVFVALPVLRRQEPCE